MNSFTTRPQSSSYGSVNNTWVIDAAGHVMTQAQFKTVLKTQFALKLGWRIIRMNKKNPIAIGLFSSNFGGFSAFAAFFRHLSKFGALSDANKANRQIQTNIEFRARIMFKNSEILTFSQTSGH